jgi:RNA polymerase sigma factor (sigma-70 family)
MELDVRRELLGETAPDSPRHQEGVRGAYAWESYRADLRSFVKRQLRSTQEADDVVQAIYHRLLEYPPRDAVRDPRAWLWRVAWRVLNLARQRRMDHERHHVTAEPSTLEALANQSRLTEVASIETQLEAADELLAALDGLAPDTQVAIVRSRRDGWSYEQIGEALGISPHMAKKHIIKALKHFAAYAKQVDERAPRKGVP